MASIIPGYEYDIFISYRQKDNKGDRWVSEFVDALKTELESTFKEEISVYFDINPHDGQPETNDVDASLKEKVKCLIFIPIISLTYCDPKDVAKRNKRSVLTSCAVRYPERTKVATLVFIEHIQIILRISWVLGSSNKHEVNFDLLFELVLSTVEGYNYLCPLLKTVRYFFIMIIFR